MIRVLIVEDQAILRESLARSVGDQPDMTVVSAIADASDALGVALKERPDMILMDVCTEHDSNGIVAAARIKEQLPECRVIIMTGMPEITFVDQAREAGVDRLAAVGAALVMFVGIAITLLGQLGQRADDAAMRDGLPLATDDLGGDLAPTCSDPEPVEAAELTSDERLDAFVATFGLTERERDILEVLVVSDQSVQDIATTLFLSRSTLYRHISSINKKTGTASRVALINFFWSWTPKD